MEGPARACRPLECDDSFRLFIPPARVCLRCRRNSLETVRGPSARSDERGIMDSFELVLFYNAGGADDLGAPFPSAPFFKRGLWGGGVGQGGGDSEANCPQGPSTPAGKTLTLNRARPSAREFQ